MSTLAIGVGWSSDADTAKAVNEAVDEAKRGLEGVPSAAFVCCTVEHDAATLVASLRAREPDVLVHGITTSLGGLSSRGVVSGPGGAVGVLLLGTKGGVSFCTGYAPLGDPYEAGRSAANQILASAREPVRVLLFNASPGEEEAILEGVEDVLPGVPAWGGSAADHAIAGQWKVLSNAGVASAGVSILAVCGKVSVGGAFVAPYKPTGREAPIQASQGRRLLTLGGLPAARMLAEWVGPALLPAVRDGGNILAQTALHPVAIRKKAQGASHYLTIHPASIQKDTGAVDLFARVPQGQTLCEMTASPDDLVDAWPAMVELALANARIPLAQVKVALVIHCAGCAGALGQRVDESLRLLGNRLPGVPVFGLCTFGEQGHVPGLGNLHQDLSLGLLVLG